MIVGSTIFFNIELGLFFQGHLHSNVQHGMLIRNIHPIFFSASTSKIIDANKIFIPVKPPFRQVKSLYSYVYSDWRNLYFLTESMKKETCTELIGTGPKVISCCCCFRKRGFYCSEVLNRYSRMSSKYILPEPPGTVMLPFVPRPTAILSTLVRATPWSAKA
jgi:hypothetical protein